MSLLLGFIKNHLFGTVWPRPTSTRRVDELARCATTGHHAACRPQHIICTAASAHIFQHRLIVFLAATVIALQLQLWRAPP
jgi:hypothetical protein